MLITLNEKSLLMTEEGLKEVSKLSLGDKILGQNKKFIQVLSLSPLIQKSETIFLKGHGHPEFITNKDMLFLYSNYVRTTNEDGKAERNFIEPNWVGPLDMNGNFWASPTKFPRGSSHGSISDNMAWILGAYLSSGNIVGNNIFFSTNHHREEELITVLAREGFYVKKRQKGSVFEYYLTHAVLAGWLKEMLPFKNIPYFIYGEKKKVREEFFAGLIWGNGIFENDSYKIAIRNNKPLAIGIKLLSQTLGHSTALHLSRSGKYKKIERWQITAELSARSSTLIDDNRYGLIREVNKSKKKYLSYELELKGNRKGVIVDGLIVK